MSDMKMDALRISPIDTSDGGHTVTARFNLAGKTQPVYFRAANPILTPSLEAFIAIALTPCMKKGLPIIAEGEISPRFFEALPRIQEIFQRWKPKLHPVEILGAVPRLAPPMAGERVGVFFTGGVDSFYTLLKNQAKITDLVFIHGIEIPLSNRLARTLAIDMIRQVAATMHKTLVEIETNLSDFVNRYLFWEVTHGPALASAGLTLQRIYKELLIAATYTRPENKLNSSHPTLDPLWSTEGLEFIHDGEELTRMEKVAQISQKDLVLDSLRVCQQPPPGKLNCGVCEKCTRTMVQLRATGRLDRCDTLPHQLDLRQVGRIYSRQPGKLYYIKPVLPYLESSGHDPELARVLHKVVFQPRWVKWLAKARLNLRNRLTGLYRFD